MREPLLLDADLDVLPELPGSGNLRSLRETMQLERSTNGTNDLKALLDDFVAESDPTARYARFETLLFKCAGVDGDHPASRGSYLDARKLGVLEKSYGQALGTPDYWRAVSWDNAYRDLTEGFYASLLREAHYASLFEQITYTTDPATGKERGNLAAVIVALQAGLVTDPGARRRRWSPTRASAPRRRHCGRWPACRSGRFASRSRQSPRDEPTHVIGYDA